MILSSIRLSVRPSVCDAVQCGWAKRYIVHCTASLYLLKTATESLYLWQTMKQNNPSCCWDSRSYCDGNFSGGEFDGSGSE